MVGSKSDERIREIARDMLSRYDKGRCQDWSRKLQKMIEFHH